MICKYSHPVGCLCTYSDSVLLCNTVFHSAFTYIYSDLFGGDGNNEPMPIKGPGHTWRKTVNKRRSYS